MRTGVTGTHADGFACLEGEGGRGLVLCERMVRKVVLVYCRCVVCSRVYHLVDRIFNAIFNLGNYYMESSHWSRQEVSGVFMG